jgi:hypothetical protein
MFAYRFRPAADWEIRLLSTAQLLQPLLNTPSYSPATRLALSGFEVEQNTRDSAARGQLEISGAFRRR